MYGPCFIDLILLFQFTCYHQSDFKLGKGTMIDPGDNVQEK